MDLYDIRRELNSGKSIYDIPLKVTFYARVSTEKDEQTHSLKNQIDYYSDFINKNPNWEYVEGYIDEGLSGTSVTKRDAFLKMIDDARKRKFDFIITKEISRFSRNTLDSIKFTQQLLGYGVGVLFQSDNINTLMPDAELRLTIMSSIAQDEVRKISERVKFGFKRAIEKGVVLGNSKMWGYTKQDGKLVIDEKEAQVVREIFDMYVNSKLGIRSICNDLAERGVTTSNGNPMAFSTVRNIIINPKYKGYYCGNKTNKYDYKLNDRKYLDESDWVMYKDEETVPPIVSEEIWEKANYILKQRSDKMKSEDKTSYQNKFPYSGKIFCGQHDVPFYRALYKYSGGNKEVWQCKHYSEKGRAGCESPTIYTSELNAVLKDCFNTVFQDKIRIVKEMQDVYKSILENSTIAEDIKKEKNYINELMKKKDKLLEHSIAGRINDSEFATRNNGFNDEIERVKIEIEKLMEQQSKSQDLEYTLETLNEAITHELNFEDGFDESLVEALLQKVIVSKANEKNTIHLSVYFKVVDKQSQWEVKRKRNNTPSVCFLQYI